MAKGFGADVAAWEQKAMHAEIDTQHEALRGLSDMLSSKTPRVSGNLDNSRTITTGGPPTVDWKTKKFRDPEDAINNAIAGVELGETAWLGFRAPYAHKIEPKYAMARLTAQLWKAIVDGAASVVRSRGSR